MGAKLCGCNKNELQENKEENVFIFILYISIFLFLVRQYNKFIFRESKSNSK